VSGSIHAYAIMSGERWAWQPLGGIEHSLRTGRPAFDDIFGTPVFQSYTLRPEAGRVGAAGLRSLSALDEAAILAAYNFPVSGTVVDVGGGQGSLLISILTANSNLRGMLF